jgi:hypothetical protein
MQLYIDAQTFSFNASILRRIAIPDPLDETSIEFFDWLGSKLHYFYGQKEKHLRLSRQIAQAYVDNPMKKGLLVVLGSLVRNGNKLSIPTELLGEDGSETDMERLSAVLIQLAQGGWNEIKARKLAERLASLGTEPYRIRLALQTIRNHSLRARSKESFAFALRDQLEPSRFNDHSQVVDFLDELMRQRRSKITYSAKWKDCGLPLLP